MDRQTGGAVENLVADTNLLLLQIHTKYNSLVEQVERVSNQSQARERLHPQIIRGAGSCIENNLFYFRGARCVRGVGGEGGRGRRAAGVEGGPSGAGQGGRRIGVA